MKLKRLLLPLVALLVLMGCDPSASGGNKASISSVGYYITNTPQDWWSSGSGPSLNYYFRINFSQSLSASSIASAKIYLPNSSSSWTLDASALSSSGTYMSGGGFSYSVDDRELPVGNLKAKVTFTDGRVSEYAFTMGVPGVSSNNGYSYVYCRDDKASALYPGVSTEALMRPTVTSSVKSASSLTVNFTVNGSNVHNGWIWFYGASGSYIGRSAYFLDATTGNVFGGMNSGNFFNSTDGSANSVAVTQSDIVDSYGNAISAAAFGDIAQAWVVVVDGAQYIGPGSYADYDYRAISGGITF